MYLGELPLGPVYHTFTDLTTSNDKRQHVGSRFELFELDDYDYYTYFNIFKPGDLIYAGWHKRDDKDGGWYSGSVKDSNHLWHLRDQYPPEDFMLIALQGHHSKDEALVAEDKLIEMLWGSVGKHRNGGRCLNLARNSLGFKGYARFGGKNSMYGKTGADNPLSNPVIELVSGKVFSGQCEASRELGTNRVTITDVATTSAKKIKEGKALTASNQRTMNRKPNSNYGNCWLSLETFQEELDKGNSVEVVSKIQQ